MVKELDQSIKVAMANLEKQFGKNSVMHLGNVEIEEIDFIPTGSPTLDDALGLGGLPIGRIIEIYGGESTGKSSLALSVAAEAQKMGKTVLYIDTEHAMDLGYARDLGVDIENLLFSQPTYGEEALTIAEDMIKTNAVGLVVVDSVANLTPKAEMDGTMGQAHVGLLPRLMSQSMRKLTSLVNQTHCTVIFINQVREKVGVFYGSPEIQPGGRALKFYSSVRIELRKKEMLADSNGEITGVRTKAKVIKNKVGPPLKEVFFNINYGKGIDQAVGLTELGLQKGIIKMAGSWVKYGDETLFQGANNAGAFFEENPDRYEELYSLILGKE